LSTAYVVLGRSMLAQAAMPVVFVLAEKIRRGTILWWRRKNGL